MQPVLIAFLSLAVLFLVLISILAVAVSLRNRKTREQNEDVLFKILRVGDEEQGRGRRRSGQRRSGRGHGRGRRSPREGSRSSAQRGMLQIPAPPLLSPTPAVTVAAGYDEGSSRRDRSASRKRRNRGETRYTSRSQHGMDGHGPSIHDHQDRDTRMHSSRQGSLPRVPTRTHQSDSAKGERQIRSERSPERRRSRRRRRQQEGGGLDRADDGLGKESRERELERGQGRTSSPPPVTETRDYAHPRHPRHTSRNGRQPHGHGEERDLDRTSSPRRSRHRKRESPRRGDGGREEDHRGLDSSRSYEGTMPRQNGNGKVHEQPADQRRDDRGDPTYNRHPMQRVAKESGIDGRATDGHESDHSIDVNDNSGIELNGKNEDPSSTDQTSRANGVVETEVEANEHQNDDGDSNGQEDQRQEKFEKQDRDGFFCGTDANDWKGKRRTDDRDIESGIGGW